MSSLLIAELSTLHLVQLQQLHDVHVKDQPIAVHWFKIGHILLQKEDISMSCVQIG